jgi:ABC-type antimicrobial peptide transport system permease subunit
MDAMAEIKGAVHDLDPRLAIADAGTLKASLEEILRHRRAITALSGVFAVLAMAVTAAGLYALLAYSVSRRRREFGIRMAVGASRSEIVRLVIREGLQRTVIGIGVGVLVAIAATNVVKGLLFDVVTYDVATYSTALVIVLAVALVASWIPGKRASLLDPSEAIATE